MNHALVHHVVAEFTQPPGLPPLRPGLDPDKVTPGVIGLVFFIVMAVAVALLVRSMFKQIKKIPKDLDAPSGRSLSARDDGSVPQ